MAKVLLIGMIEATLQDRWGWYQSRTGKLQAK